MNQVSKRPGAEPAYVVEFGGASHGFLEGRADLGGPLNASRTIAYRLNAVTRRQEDFVDFIEKRRVYVSPALRINVGRARR